MCTRNQVGMREDLGKHFGWLLVYLQGMPLILTSNEVIVSDDYDWEDVTGVQYHYPNGYRNLIKSGERFVYYRGVRRAGKKRGNALRLWSRNGIAVTTKYAVLL